MNVSELLRLLQTEHDETAARADSLREQIERFAIALAETEARLAELTATRKVIDGLTPPDHATAPAETATATATVYRGDRHRHRHRLSAHRDHVQRAPREGVPRP